MPLDYQGGPTSSQGSGKREAGGTASVEGDTTMEARGGRGGRRGHEPKGPPEPEGNTRVVL